VEAASADSPLVHSSTGTQPGNTYCPGRRRDCCRTDIEPLALAMPPSSSSCCSPGLCSRGDTLPVTPSTHLLLPLLLATFVVVTAIPLPVEYLARRMPDVLLTAVVPVVEGEECCQWQLLDARKNSLPLPTCTITEKATCNETLVDPTHRRVLLPLY
jgi:hypothetical protein